MKVFKKKGTFCCMSITSHYMMRAGTDIKVCDSEYYIQFAFAPVIIEQLQLFTTVLLGHQKHPFLKYAILPPIICTSFNGQG